MRPIHVKSAVDQVADHLIQEITDQKLTGYIPSAKNLATELGVNHKTVAAAVNILGKKGYIVPQPSSRRRSIVVPEGVSSAGLKIGILDYSPGCKHTNRQLELIFSLREAGHKPFYLEKTLTEVDMDVSHVSDLLKKTEADAWFLNSASKEILEWFAEEDLPAFAQFGLQAGIPIAGAAPDHPQVAQDVIRRFVELGHRRIVTLIYGGQKLPSMGLTKQAIITEMKRQGLPVGLYNIPYWQNDSKGFRECLDSLFLLTPPSAFYVEECSQVVALLTYFCENGIRVPQDVSVVCAQYSEDFFLCDPVISHVKWDYQPLVRCVIQWANNLANGIDDKKQSRIKVDLVEGGTMGPAPKYMK